MLIPVLYLSLSIRDPNHVDDNVYNNHKHPAYAYRKFWLFQEPNRHSPNFFRTACNNHPMNYWTYYILHINAFDNLSCANTEQEKATNNSMILSCLIFRKIIELINTIKVANISIKKTINNLFLLITASLNHQ